MNVSIDHPTNAVVTDRGRKFAWKLNSQIGTTYEIEQICSLIHRQARTYDRIQEAWCSDEMSDYRRAWMEAREARIERRIIDLVDRLPEPDSGPWSVRFDGDPRGYTVRLVTVDGREYGVYEGE